MVRIRSHALRYLNSTGYGDHFAATGRLRSEADREGVGSTARSGDRAGVRHAGAGGASGNSASSRLNEDHSVAGHTSECARP